MPLTRTEKWVLDWLVEEPTRSALRYPNPRRTATRSMYCGGARNRLLNRMRDKGLIDPNFKLTDKGRAELQFAKLGDLRPVRP